MGNGERTGSAGLGLGGRVRCEKEGKGKGMGNGNGNGGASDQSLHIHLTSPHLTNGPWRESGSQGVKASATWNRPPAMGAGEREWMAWDGMGWNPKPPKEGMRGMDKSESTAHHSHSIRTLGMGHGWMAGWAWEHRESNGR